MKLSAALFLTLAIGLAACSDDAVNPTEQFRPGIGSRFVLVRWYTGSNDGVPSRDTSRDTTKAVLVSNDESYAGRDGVYRFAEYRGGQVIDTQYVHYLSSGDVELYYGDQLNRWILAPFKSVDPDSMIDTFVSQDGNQTFTVIDTMLLTPIGSNQQLVMGKNLNDERVWLQNVATIAGQPQAFYDGLLTFIPEIGYIGLSRDTITDFPGNTEYSETTLQSYDLK